MKEKKEKLSWNNFYSTYLIWGTIVNPQCFLVNAWVISLLFVGGFGPHPFSGLKQIGVFEGGLAPIVEPPTLVGQKSNMSKVKQNSWRKYNREGNGKSLGNLELEIPQS